MEEDVELFINTESANFGDGIVGCSSLDDGPVDGVWDILPYELSDINTQSCATPLLILCVYITIVLVYPGLNWVVGRPSVGLPVAGVSPGDSGSVHQVVHLTANSRKDSAGIRLSMWSASAFKLLLGCCSIVTIQNFVVVP